MDDDDDLVGTSPINLPDPSLFLDDHENDMENFEMQIQGESHGQGGPLQQRQFLEEENEKRKLEQIYMVAGEEKKTHISVVELYGFFSWNLSAIVFIIYMIWAFVPNDVLNSFGIYYIPDKYYAIAIPLWFAVTLFTILQLYVTICIYATPSPESYDTLQDRHTILKNPNIEQESSENPALIKDNSSSNGPRSKEQKSTNINRKNQNQRFKVQKVEEMPEEEDQLTNKEPIEQPKKKSNGSNGEQEQVKKSQFSNDKAKIADVFELPITVVNNVLYQQIRQQYNQVGK